MKNIILLLALFTISQSGFSQFNGKPLYDVLVRQYPDTFGTFRMELYPTIAPLHCVNFDTLAQQGFYDSLAFHRVVPNFVIQGGDPNSRSGPSSTWGQGAPWQQTVPAEFGPLAHNRSIIGAARGTDINSATSQFYINTANNTNLNGNYTAYGKVISGMNVVDSVEAVPRNSNDLPLQKVDMFINFVGIDSSAPSVAPTLTSPADGAVDLFGNLNFTWSPIAATDFLLFTVEFSKQSNFSQIDYKVDVGRNTTSIQPLENLEQGYQTYYWRVSTNNGGKLSASSSRSFTTYIAPPILNRPVDLSTNIYTNPNFKWYPVNGADSYNLVISKLPSLASPFFYELDTNTTYNEIIVRPLASNTTYYWGVRTVLDSVAGAFSEMRQFTTGNILSSISFEEVLNNLMYPNPTTGKLTFDAKSFGLQETELTLYDLNGKLLMSRRLFTTTTIDISNFPDGLYIAKLASKDQEKRVKIRKQVN